MKKLFPLLLAGLSFTVNAQDDCQYTVISNEAGTEIKTTSDYLMYEKVFGGTSQFIFFSMANNEGTPVLNFQLLAKSKEFPPAYCLDKSSKIYIQLLNGKIITLLSATDDACSKLIYDGSEKNNIRVLSGSFFFTKGSIEELESSTITFIRVKYASETMDYPIRKELQSETIKGKYFPEAYFRKNLKCILQ